MEEDKDCELCTVIGVVGSVKTGDLAEQNPVGQVYFSYRQYVPRKCIWWSSRERDDSADHLGHPQGGLAGGSELPVFDTKTMPERHLGSLLNRRAAMVLCLIFAGLALLLSAIGSTACWPTR